jgi:DNA-binding SARP family transcriptional activator/tetratricopeptide (TPR) repeat protein
MIYLRAKLSVPELEPHYLDRPRLQRRFSGRANLFCIIAPAGYGKTVLAVQLVAKLPASRRAWIHLDCRDDDPVRFCAYFLEAIAEKILPLRKSGIQERLFSGQSDLSGIAEDLCFFFEEYRGKSTWIVLDNWETVDRQKSIGRFLSQLVEDGTGKLKIILTSRRDPSFPTRRLMEQGRIERITKGELAFTFPEFHNAARRWSDRRFDDKQLERLWKLTAGWCVSLGLLFEGPAQDRFRDGDDLVALALDSDSLVGYVNEELFPELPDGHLDFLARSSLLDAMTTETCRSVVEDEERIERNLKFLAASSLPHFSLGDSEGLRLHPVIRQAANRVLRERLTEPEVAALYQRASNAQKEAGLIVEAIELLLELPDYDAVLEAVRAQWYRLIELNAQAKVRAWLEEFPKAVRKRPKYIELMSNLLSISGQNHELIEFLSDKVHPASFPDHPETVANSWMHYHWALLHESGDPRYEVTKESRDRLVEMRGPFNAMLMSGFETVLAYAAMSEMRVPLGLEHLERSLELQGETSADSRILTRNNIALFRQMIGQTELALRELEACAQEAEARSSYTTLRFVLCNIAEPLMALGKRREALESLDRCIAIMRRHDVHNLGLEMNVERIRGLILWSGGSPKEGLAHLERAYALSKGFAPAEGLATGLLLEYFSLTMENPIQVVPSEDRPTSGRSDEARLIGLGKATWVALQESRADRAAASAAEMLEIADRGSVLPYGITARVFLALCAHRSGRKRGCKKHLSEALPALERIGWVYFPLVTPQLSSFVFVQACRYGLGLDVACRLVTRERAVDLAPAFREALDEQDLPLDEAERLIEGATTLRVRGLSNRIARYRGRRRKGMTEKVDAYLTVAAAEPLPPLEIRMLNDFTVTANSRLIRFLRKKSKTMLQYLLVEHPQPVHEEILMDALWPESDADKARAALQTTVRDLRRSLDPYHEPRGHSYVVHGEEHYSLHLPEGSFCDAHRFRSIVKRHLSSIRERGELAPDLLDGLFSALSLFRGEFLPGQRYESFAVEYRESIQKEYLDAALLLSRRLVETNRGREATVILEQGLRIDPLWGDGVQGLMQTRARNGDLCGALRLYRDYERRLREELDLPPDADLRRQFERLCMVK